MSNSKKPVGLDRVTDNLNKSWDSREERRMNGDSRSNKTRGQAEKLLTRIATGVVYVVIILAALFLGPLATSILVTGMAWVCCSELLRISRMAGRMPNEIIALATAVAYPLCTYFIGISALVLVTVLQLMVTAGWYVVSPRASLSDVAVTVFAPIYTSLLFSSIVLIRASDPGIAGAFLALGVWGCMWANDSLAYLVGSRFGVHKMAPRVSPNKSWEGFVGGLLGSVIVWVILAAFNVCGVTYPLAIVAGILVGIVSVMGDLFESRIKRGVVVKDSGNFMPGHGGLLDRSDSMLFGGAVALIVLILGGIL